MYQKLSTSSPQPSALAVSATKLGWMYYGLYGL